MNDFVQDQKKKEFDAAVRKIAAARGAIRTAAEIKKWLRNHGQSTGAYPNLKPTSNTIENAESEIAFMVRRNCYTAARIEKVIKTGKFADEIVALLKPLNDQYADVQAAIRAAEKKQERRPEVMGADDWVEKKSGSPKWHTFHGCSSVDYSYRTTRCYREDDTYAS